jgi:hypothetical protein
MVYTVPDGSPEQLNVVVTFENDCTISGEQEIDKSGKKDGMPVDDFVDLEHSGWLGTSKAVRTVQVCFGDTV